MTGSSIVARDEFMRGWSEFTGGILNGLDWANVFCAGGAILGNLAKDRTGFSSSDIDLFIYGIHDDEEANKKLRHIHQVVTRNTLSRGDVIRTARAVTILNSYPYRHVQVILRMYKSPAEVLLGFDIDSCTVGFDGRDVWCMPRFKRALTKRYNLVNISRRSLTYEQRLYKYSKRGFAVAVPNLDKSRISSSIFQKRLRDVGGLAKLVLYDHQAQRQSAGGVGGFGAGPRFGRPAFAAGGGADADNESSDYNGDLSIPWGPGMQADQIMRVLNVKDKKQFFAKLNKAKNGGQQDGFGASAGAQARVRPSHLFEKIFLDQPAGDQKPIEWIKNNPAYQDYDNGFKRQLMTGSFHPPAVGENWEEGAYADGSTAAAAPGALSSIAGRPASSFSDAAAVTAPAYGGLSKKATVVTAATTPSFAQKQPSFGTTPFAVKAKKTEAAAATSTASPSSSAGGYTGGFSLAGYYASVQPAEQPVVAPMSPKVPKKTAPSTSSPGGGYSLAALGGGGTSLAALDRTSPPPQPGGSMSDSYAAPQPGGSAFVGFATPTKAAHSHSYAAPASVASPGLSAFGPQPGVSFGGAASAVDNMHMQIQAQQQIIQQHQQMQQHQTIRQALQQQRLPTPASQGPIAHGTGSGVLASKDEGEAKPSTKLLLLVALLFKQNRLSQDERGKLKDLIIVRNDMVFAALEVFELDQDLDELVDTLKRVCRLA
jgi:hypothetical protein